MKRFAFLCFFAVSSVLAAPPKTPVALENLLPDERIVLARKAVQAGDRAEFERIARTLEGHELSAYIDYWRIRLNFDSLGRGTVQRFIERYPGEFLAEKMRGDWLRFLGKRGRWDEFNAEYPALVQQEQDLRCYALQASRKRRGKTATLNAATPLWLNLADPPEACLPLIESLIVEKRVQVDDVWARIRRQLEAGKVEAARYSMNYLPENQTPDEATAKAVTMKPLPWLKRLPKNFSENQMLRELAILAIVRVARSDVPLAAEHLKRIEKKLKPGEREWVWSQVAGWAAQRHRPEALAWFRKAGRAPLSNHLIQWKARAALRAQNWQMLRGIIERMPEELAEQRAWIYWRGRALHAEGRKTEAKALFEKIAGTPDFYSQLASEELGRAIVVPPKANAPTNEELERASSNPGLRRSLALIRAGLRFEGVLEWNWAMRGMSDRELLAASEFARSAGFFDRAISAADRTQTEHDYSLRYLAPFGETIRPAAKKLSLDDAWVYGLMRQESRFIVDAKSVVGASGLMQLMPKTARWVAKQIGLQDYQPSRVNDTETNVLLGTTYMRMVLDSLDEHPVLASAAYNAGPGRARQWRSRQPIEGAIYAETIPFNETRDYVKKVMSNTVYYAILFDAGPQLIKRRLGVVQPPAENETKREYLP
ncbi:MAG: lytic transglycosylase domain-containing protein [Candidatus Accumulibacter sp.]|jgi:soluble lytic murein transglycosylase|nr:lytic transglycosylase domain-containing protein [Accumulibacter sp.]